MYNRNLGAQRPSFKAPKIVKKNNPTKKSLSLADMYKGLKKNSSNDNIKADENGEVEQSFLEFNLKNKRPSFKIPKA